MDNKLLLALVWVVGGAVVAALAYCMWDMLRWVAARLRWAWAQFAPVLGAACAVPVRVGAPIRIKTRRLYRRAGRSGMR